MTNPVSLGKLVAGGIVLLDLTLTRDGGVYNLTNKTVVATIRRQDNDAIAIGAGELEDMAVTVDDPTNGGVTLALSAAHTTLLAPPAYLPSTSYVYYLIQFKVTTDNYILDQKGSIAVSRKLD